MHLVRSLLVVPVIALLAACGGPNPPKPPPSVIAEQRDGDLKVELLARSALKVGFNEVFFRLTRDGSSKPLTSAQITMNPMMHMADHSHGCPFTNPGTQANADGLFAGEIVFNMASGAMGTWDTQVQITEAATSTTNSVTFANVAVAESNMKKSFMVSNGATQVGYMVTLYFPEGPKVGQNPFILTVHKKEGMMFVPEPTMTVTMHPEMPSMGHSSPNNIDPTYLDNGKYEGSVNLTMAGDWTIDFTFSLGGSQVGTVQYAIQL